MFFYLGSIIENKLFLTKDELKSKKVFLVLHGLFGRGKNWTQIVKSLSEKISAVFITVDLRNHGENQSSNNLSYSLMVKDVFILLQKLELKKISFIGHSMGGKVAMIFSLLHNDLVENLIIVDIAPVKYLSNEIEIVDYLLDIDLNKIKSRKDADDILKENLNDKSLRLFLLQNLIFSENSYRWSINLNTLKKSMNNLRDFPINNLYKFEQDVLCVFGENSNYVNQENKKIFRTFFPNVNFEKLKNSGHWLHAENPLVFVEKIKNYLMSN